MEGWLVGLRGIRGTYAYFGLRFGRSDEIESIMKITQCRQNVSCSLLEWEKRRMSVYDHVKNQERCVC
jgi:hypothetical protein